MRPDYAAYLASPAWRARAEAAKDLVGRRCQICYVHEDVCPLDAHHRTYRRLGHEEPFDITVLCRKCHEIYESRRMLAEMDDEQSIAFIARRVGGRR